MCLPSLSLHWQAFVPIPASKTALIGKAAAIIASTLALAVHALWARPFASAQAWKGPVRAALLVLAAAAAAVVAWAGALDLRIIVGARAAGTLTAGAYVLVVIFVVAVAALVGGVGTAMLRGVREENARMRLAQATSASPVVPSSDAGAVGESPVALQDPQFRIDVGTAPASTVAAATVAAPGSASDAQVAFSVHVVRRGGGGRKNLKGGVSGSRRRRKQAVRFGGDPSLSAAAKIIQADAGVGDAGVIGACEGVVEALGRLPAKEVGRTSAALLPRLSARLDAALGDDDEGGAKTLAAICQAMAALSDHADAAALLLLSGSGLSQQLAALLQRGLRGLAQNDASRNALSHALWLLGNVVANEQTAAAFVAAGGAGLLVAYLAPSASSFSSPDAALHVGVAIASLSAHAVAAAALLDAGALPPLARVLSCAQSDAGSLADAEAACCALANVLKHAEAAGGRAAARACYELATSEAITGCTAVLRRHVAEVAGSHLGDRDSAGTLATHASEVLLSAVRCAHTAAADTAEDPYASALVEQAVAADTGGAARALLDLFSSADGEDERSTKSGRPLYHSLTALFAELQRSSTLQAPGA